MLHRHHHHHHHHHLRLTSLVSHFWGWTWYASPPLLLTSAISSVMLLSSSSTLLQVFFGLPTGLLPSTYSSTTLLTMLFSSLRFTWPNHLNHIFLNLCSGFSTPHLLLTFLLAIMSCHLTLDMYLNILWSQLACSLSNLSVSFLCQPYYMTNVEVWLKDSSS